MSKLLHHSIFRVNQVFRVMKEYSFKRNLINEIKCFATVAANLLFTNYIGSILLPVSVSFVMCRATGIFSFSSSTWEIMPTIRFSF